MILQSRTSALNAPALWSMTTHSLLDSSPGSSAQLIVQTGGPMKRLTRPKPKAAAKPAPMSHDDVRAILRSAAADLRAIIGKLEPITSGGLPPVPAGAWDGDGSDECLMVEGDIPESLDFYFRTAIL